MSERNLDAFIAKMNETERQLKLLLTWIGGKSGAVCMDTRCPVAEAFGVPHMMTDMGPHPALRSQSEEL